MKLNDLLLKLAAARIVKSASAFDDAYNRQMNAFNEMMTQQYGQLENQMRQYQNRMGWESAEQASPTAASTVYNALSRIPFLSRVFGGWQPGRQSPAAASPAQQETSQASTQRAPYEYTPPPPIMGNVYRQGTGGNPATLYRPNG